jgi:hypothetical protein
MSRLHLAGDVTVGEFLLELSDADGGVFDGVDPNMVASEALKQLWDEELKRDMSPYSLALIRAVVPFILNVRIARGINSIRDILNTPIAPLVKVYDSRIHKALMDFLARSTYKTSNKPRLYDETMEGLFIFDGAFFDGRHYLARDNAYMGSLASFKLRDESAVIDVNVVDSQDLSDTEIITLMQ